MVRLPRMEFFPILGRSYVLDWDDGTWPCLPGGTWGSLHMLQAAQCPSSGSLPQCAASGQMQEPGLMQAVFHVIISEWWVKEQIYRLRVCCFNLPLRGWSRTESVVNTDFKKIMRCFASQAGIQSYFLYSSSSSKKKKKNPTKLLPPICS